MSAEGEETWEDDEMDELFSFGVEGGSTAGSSPVLVDTPTPSIPESTRERAGSDDSFLEMLDETKLDVSGDILPSSGTGTTPAVVDDAETQEILNWLDQDESKIPTLEDEPAIKEETKDETSQPKGQPQADKAINKETTKETVVVTPPTPAPTIVPPPKPKKPTFETLEQAVLSPESTIPQIRGLFVEEGMQINDSLRPQLWSRIVCNKSLDDLQASSVADSYAKWKTNADLDSFKDARSVWIKQEAAILAERIGCMPRELATTELSLLLIFHYIGNDAKDVDPLLPPVACTILAAGLPPSAASVVLSNIMPAFMPLLALTQQERHGAATTLHSQFYLLACYHLPLLVFHLDRYAPGWHWPRQLTKEKDDAVAWRNTDKNGVVPQSWLISHLAGECHGTFMNPKWLLNLWDLILTSSNNSLRFFLSLAVLEKHSDSLLMITGDHLVRELNRIMEFKEDTTLEGFAIESEEEMSSSEAIDWVQEWCNRASDIWESTPRSVVQRLRKAEDDAVSTALMERQRKAEELLQAKLDEEARLHREAMEAEREKRAEEGRERLNRARLIAYYRQHNPGKEGNIDKIMETYGDRLEILDSRLKTKYGVGFNPALKPTLSVNTNKLLSSMNQGLSNQRKRIGTVLLRKEEEDDVDTDTTKSNQVAVKVSSNEVLPIVCWAKETDPFKRAAYRPSDGLKFYLVDSRPEETVQEQGGFPTALKMSPEALLDPDRMKEQEDMFESLRGAAHIVVMGEGFSAVPMLYNQKINPSLAQLIKEDASRTSLCALFFVKRGFPFVSILEGGFCGAHAWLCREGPKRNLYANAVLVDYNGEGTMFGELEKVYREQKEFANASASAKTQMALQGLFDKSMTTVTRSKMRLESLAANLENTETRFKKFFKADEAEGTKTASEGSRFRINFSGNRVGVTETEAPVDSSKQSDILTSTKTSAVTSTSTQPADSASPAAPTSQPKVPPIQEDEKKSRFPSLGVPSFGGISNGIGSALKMVDLSTKDNADGAHEGRFASLGNALNGSIAKMTEISSRETPDGGQENRFANFGAAFNKSLKKTAQSAKQQDLTNVLKRNPFARFGGKEQVQSRFAGMKQMKNPLARARASEEEAEIDFAEASTSGSLSLTEEPMQQVALTEP